MTRILRFWFRLLPALCGRPDWPLSKNEAVRRLLERSEVAR